MRLAPVLSLLLMLGLVLPGGGGDAYACSCMIGDDEEYVRQLMEWSDAVVVGRVVERHQGDPDTVTFAVERQYDGPHSRTFTVRYRFGEEHDQCPGYTVTEGTRHLLSLDHREPQPPRSEWETRMYGPPDPGDPPGVYTPMGCHQSMLASTGLAQDQMAAMERVGSPWSPDGGANGLGVAMYFAGSIAALAGLVALSRRSNRR